MIYLSAETPRNQEMIERFHRAFDQLRKHLDDKIEKLQNENRKLRK